MLRAPESLDIDHATGTGLMSHRSSRRQQLDTETEARHE
jgi:hypothetical protein